MKHKNKQKDSERVARGHQARITRLQNELETANAEWTDKDHSLNEARSEIVTLLNQVEEIKKQRDAATEYARDEARRVDILANQKATMEYNNYSMVESLIQERAELVARLLRLDQRLKVCGAEQEDPDKNSFALFYGINPVLKPSS